MGADHERSVWPIRYLCAVRGPQRRDRDADLREDVDGQDARRGGIGLHRQRQVEDPGQGWDPDGDYDQRKSSCTSRVDAAFPV